MNDNGSESKGQGDVGGGRCERTHETHQTAPSCLDFATSMHNARASAQQQESIFSIPSQCFRQLVGVPFDFENLNRLV